MYRSYNRSETFQNYRDITAKFASEGSCGHAMSKGDVIGWNRVTKKTQCADCWRAWCVENAEADLCERGLQ